MDIRIAGAEGRSLGGVEKTVDLQMITPGDQQNHDTGKHQEMLAGFFRNFNLGQGTGSVAGQQHFPDNLDPADLYIPDNRHQCGKQQHNQQLLPDKDIKRQCEYIKPDVLVKYGIIGTERLLI